MGNWGVHILDDVRNNIYQDKIIYPRRIAATGGRFAWNDAGNTPNLDLAVLDTGVTPTVVMLCNLNGRPGKKGSAKFKGPGSGYIAHCQGGRLEGNRGGATAWDTDGKTIKQFKNTARKIRISRTLSMPFVKMTKHSSMLQYALVIILRHGVTLPT